MKLNTRKEGGYVAILMIFITFAIITFVIVRSDLFIKKTNPENNKTYLEQNLESVNRAEEVKKLIEKNNQETMEEL